MYYIYYVIYNHTYTYYYNYYESLVSLGWDGACIAKLIALEPQHGILQVTRGGNTETYAGKCTVKVGRRFGNFLDSRFIGPWGIKTCQWGGDMYVLDHGFMQLIKLGKVYYVLLSR